MQGRGLLYSVGDEHRPTVRLGLDEAYDLRDALYDNSSSASSHKAHDAVQLALEAEDGPRVWALPRGVAADMIQAIDRMSSERPLPTSLVELRGYLDQLERAQ